MREPWTWAKYASETVRLIYITAAVVTVAKVLGF
jgi:hypothetical protein